ncbi:MAG: proteasome assembly chaperone family protein [Candidatus Methanomethylophilaceae archaeon]|nr:proteasome assembly chaperone family protein [Candidatus Methanomethylophilaceae archaeon]
MKDLVLHTYDDMMSDDAVAIVGFPSLGLVSSIATSFLAKELKLDLIAAVSSPSFPPYAIVQAGVPMPPVRFYGGCRKKDEKCESGIGCDDLFVITSEFVPKPEQTDEMAELVIEWCVNNNVHTLITLDGIPLFGPDMYSIYGVGSTESARQMMKDYEIESIEDGMVRGLSGMMLLKASEIDLDVITLLGSAKQDIAFCYNLPCTCDTSSHAPADARRNA